MIVLLVYFVFVNKYGFLGAKLLFTKFFEMFTDLATMWLHLCYGFQFRHHFGSQSSNQYIYISVIWIAADASLYVIITDRFNRMKTGTKNAL